MRRSRVLYPLGTISETIFCKVLVWVFWIVPWSVFRCSRTHRNSLVWNQAIGCLAQDYYYRLSKFVYYNVLAIILSVVVVVGLDWIGYGLLVFLNSSFIRYLVICRYSGLHGRIFTSSLIGWTSRWITPILLLDRSRHSYGVSLILLNRSLLRFSSALLIYKI